MNLIASKKRTILAVDDKIDNLKVLIKYLEDSGFELMVAQSGREALDIIARITPHIILLDVLMPGMDGFETCRLLKQNKSTREIPVIFMTALTETIDKVKGFAVGAVDYLTKPLQHEEVLARIKAHVTIREYHQQLKKQNALLREKNTQLKNYTDKINADIERARIVQRQFLPAADKMPFHDRIHWAYCFEPADQIGGDYFDAAEIEKNQLAILFSDVCGHGMPAAFITAVIKTTFQAWLDCAGPLSKLAVALNRNLCRLTPIDSFAAVFLAIYELDTGMCRYINFGHTPEPWLVPANNQKPIQPLNQSRSLVMGHLEDLEFSAAELRIHRGDCIVFVSDGVVGNCDPDALLFGTDWFEKILDKNRSLPVEQFINAIKNETNNFCGPADQLDDYTVLIFKVAL